MMPYNSVTGSSPFKTTMLSQHVTNQSPSDTVSYPKKWVHHLHPCKTPKTCNRQYLEKL